MARCLGAVVGERAIPDKVQLEGGCGNHSPIEGDESDRGKGDKHQSATLPTVCAQGKR